MTWDEFLASARAVGNAAAEKIEEVQEDEKTTKAAYEKFKKAGEELRKIK